MFKMIAYFSIPYSMSSQRTKQDAALQLTKIIGKFVLDNPNWYGVNALLSTYPSVVPEDTIYEHANLLIKSADVFMVICDKGWEYDDMVLNEATYAALRKLPIKYMEAV